MVAKIIYTATVHCRGWQQAASRLKWLISACTIILIIIPIKAKHQCINGAGRKPYRNRQLKATKPSFNQRKKVCCCTISNIGALDMSACMRHLTYHKSTKMTKACASVSVEVWGVIIGFCCSVCIFCQCLRLVILSFMCGVERSHWRGCLLPKLTIYSSQTVITSFLQHMSSTFVKQSRENGHLCPVTLCFCWQIATFAYLTVIWFLSNVGMNLVIFSEKGKKKSNGWPFFNSRTGI